MNKDAFLEELRKKLSGLQQVELEERIAFYSEMIDERVSEGASEEDAVAGLGPVEDIVDHMMAEIPLTKLVGEKVKRKKETRGRRVALKILSAPLWLPLLIAFVAVLFSLYVALWSIVISLWAVDMSLAAAAIACLISVVPTLEAGNTAGMWFCIGACLVCAGLAILMFYLYMGISRGVLKLTGKALLGIKTRFVGKEA